MSEREREKNENQRNKGSKNKRLNKDEYEKLPKDWSAEERFVNRSFRIRKDVRLWIKANLGQAFETSSELSDQCAYDCKCSPITAYRWLHFWSNKRGLYLIEEQPAGLVLKERKAD